MSEITVRKMEKQDVEAVSQLEETSFSMPWTRDAFLEMTVQEDAHYLVAEQDGNILGVSGMHLNYGEAEITNVSVWPEKRGKGIATLLMKHLIREGTECGAQQFLLEVRVSNASAIHVYKSCGFEIIGTRKNFYEKPWEDAYVMQLKIDNHKENEKI